jgi:hypothetical protein
MDTNENAGASATMAEALTNVGPIELDVPIPTTRHHPLSPAQQRVLELTVGASFVLTRTPQSDVYGRSYLSDEAARLQSWAPGKGIRLRVRKLDDHRHRVWRVA